MSIDTMNHEQAVRGQAVERYVLGELTPEERDAFEGHYFDCSHCFEQVKLSAQFLHHAHEVLDPEPEKGWLAAMLGDLRRPVAAFATAALACAIGIGIFQQVQIADLKRPRIEASFFLPATQKGAEKSISVSRKSPLSLTVDFTPAAEFTSYRAQIIAESGKLKYTFPVRPSENAYSVTIGLLAGNLDAGKYTVVIEGLGRDGTPTKVGSGSFDLQFTD